MSDEITIKRKRGRPKKLATSLSMKHHYSKKEREEIARRMELEEALSKGSGFLPPEWIGCASKKIFDEVIEQYKKLGLNYLTDLDMSALAMYADALAEYLTYKSELPKIRDDIRRLRESDWEDDEKHAQTLATLYKAKGQAEKNMLVQQKIFLDLAKTLGLTPEGRVKMTITKEEKTPAAIAWFQSLQQSTSKKGTPDA